MSEESEAPKKRYLVLTGIGLTILAMYTGSVITLGMFLAFPEFLTPAKSIFADSVTKIFVGGFWFLLGWIVRGMSE